MTMQIVPIPAPGQNPTGEVHGAEVNCGYGPGGAFVIRSGVNLMVCTKSSWDIAFPYIVS